jgi:hypothetical protein
MRVKIHHLHAKGLNEVLDALAGLDRVREDDRLGTNSKIL